jgi:hypothetical protein
MNYPEVRNHRDGSFVVGDQPCVDVYNPVPPESAVPAGAR